MKDYFWKGHSMGWTPFAYHTDVKSGERHQHYPATFSAVLLGFPAVSLLFLKFAENVRKAICSHIQFDHLNRFERQIYAIIGLAGIAAFMGLLSGLLHETYNRCKVEKNNSQKPQHFDQHGEQLNLVDDSESEMEERKHSSSATVTINDEEVTEKSSLIGRDKNDSLICKISKYHPLRLMVPPTPFKTGGWIPILGLLVFAVANLVNHDLFNQFAGVSPVANSSLHFVDCNTTATNSTGCVLLLGHLLGTLTVMYGVILGVAGVVTLFHYAGAKSSETRCFTKSNNEQAQALFSTAT